jgi:predicted nuclease with TOPRIM domain
MDPQGRGDLRGKMRQALMGRMQKSLNLTDAQVASMEKKMAAHEVEMKGFNDKIEALQPKIQNIMKGSGSPEEKNAKLKPLVDEWFALRHERDIVSRAKFEQSFRTGLDPMQQIRMTMGMQKFRDELKNRLEDRMQPRRPGMDGPGRGRGMDPRDQGGMSQGPGKGWRLRQQ